MNRAADALRTSIPKHRSGIRLQIEFDMFVIAPPDLPPGNEREN
jgi:hypothetical protein